MRTIPHTWNPEVEHTVTADIDKDLSRNQGRKVFIFFFGLNEMFIKPGTKFLEHLKLEQSF